MFLGSGTGLVDHVVEGNFFLGHLRLGQDQVDGLIFYCQVTNAVQHLLEDEGQSGTEERSITASVADAGFMFLKNCSRNAFPAFPGRGAA